MSVSVSTYRSPVAISEPGSAVRAHVLGMWRAQPGALMVLGRAPGPLPKAGTARMAALTGAPGMFKAEFWPLEGEIGYGFLAAIRLPHQADRSDGAELVLRGARGADRDLRLALVASTGEHAFGMEVAASVGQYAARLTRFMLDVMWSDEGSDMRQASAVLEAFLTHAARLDGCVELIMHVPQKCVLLQGWGIRPSEPVELLLPASKLFRHTACCGDFSRSDIDAPATGNVLVLPPELASSMMSLQTVFLLTGDDLLCRRVVEPLIIDVEASIGQIRHLLPRLNGPASMHALLRAASQPQYEGRDTLNGSSRPVRAALDSAVAAAGVGVYLSGWLFDPACHIAELHICGEGFAVQLNERWTRIPRDDVSAAFCADQAFPSPLSDESGFAVAIPNAPPLDHPTYLRFTFTDGELAFMPIRLTNAGLPSALKSLLASVDLHKSSGNSIVAEHLAPFLARTQPLEATSGHLILSGPLDRCRAIVVPLRTATLPRSFVSGLLLDPATIDEQIIFICGPAWDQSQCDALIGLISFYELPASVVCVAQTPRSADAVREAAVVSQAASFLLTSPGVVGSMPGWRGLLHEAGSTKPAVCPTVLFEDRSIRFAGPKSVIFLDRTPFIRISAPYAGASADLASNADPTEVGSGTFICCLIRRSAVSALARAARFRTELGQEAAFFLSLKDDGVNGIWVSSVKVSAPEEQDDLTPPVVPLVDAWMLRQIWGEGSQCAS